VKICDFGAGAIGGYVAAQLRHAGNDVSVVARCSNSPNSRSAIQLDQLKHIGVNHDAA